MSVPVIKTPDLHAKRFRPKTTGTLNKTFLTHLRKQVPGSASLSDAQLKHLLLKVNEELGNVLIHERDGVEIPCSIGHLFVGSCPPKQQNTDFFRSQQLGYRVDYQNWETDGFQSKIFFTTQSNRYRYKHHDLWSFKACRKVTRQLAVIYPGNWKLYTEVSPTHKISDQLRKQGNAQYAKAQDARKLDTYSELDF